MTRRFDIFLTHEDHCGVEIESDRGQVIRFVVRYDGFIRGAWHTIVVFDNHGGQGHRHMMDPVHGNGEARTIPLDPKEAVTYAIDTIVTGWEGFRERYERGLPGGESDLL